MHDTDQLNHLTDISRNVIIINFIIVFLVFREKIKVIDKISKL